MLEQICDLAKEAGSAIMTIYESAQQLAVKHKKDSSPVTEADLIAHQIIKTGLTSITPHIPLLSEEDPPAWQERCHWESYWLVDPLDGTKEFIHRNGEFTVNIALIQSGSPVMGIIYAPAKNVLYASEQGAAWKIVDGVKQLLHVANGHPPLIVISRSYQDKELTDYLAQMGQHEIMVMGSSLKFCLIAEGKAIHFATHDPTQLNRQGNDIGSQYRSAIFFTSAQQKQAAEIAINNAQQTYAAPIVTTLEPFKKWYPAEKYHQNFWQNEGQQNSYCLAIIPAKLQKLRSLFANNCRSPS